MSAEGQPDCCADSEFPTCSYHTVSHIDFDDTEPLRTIGVTVADEDGWDW